LAPMRTCWWWVAARRRRCMGWALCSCTERAVPHPAGVPPAAHS
jgi:hypothetical protein